jgi:hypothetical protein
MVGRSSLIVIHTMGVLAAGIAAVFEIRTILWSGAILSLTGPLIAVLSYRARHRIGLGFGVASASAAVAWFLIIYFLSWSPDTAHLPVSLFLIVFAVASIPAAVFSILEMLAPLAGAENRFQFSIGTMLSITFFIALYLGILRALDIFGRLFSLWSHGS